MEKYSHAHARTHTLGIGLSLLWVSICSLDLVTVVAFEGAVVMVTGETVEACIFSNNLHRQTNNQNPFSHLNITSGLSERTRKA